MSAIATVKTARSRQGQSVPILEYDFESGGVAFAVSNDPSHTPLKSGSAYLISSTVPIFLSVSLTQNESVGPGNEKTTFITAGLPFHIFAGEDCFLSIVQHEEAGSAFITRVLEK